MPSATIQRVNRPLATFLRLLPKVLLVLLFAVAAWNRFRLPTTPLFDPDIWCYLNPPLSKLLGGKFQHTYGQCFLYPGMLYAVLAVGADCRWLTVAQHLLGLGTGALLLVAWRQARRFLPAPLLPGWLFDLGGLWMAAVYLLSTTSIHFECQLRPEGVFPFFAMLNICCNLAFIRRRFLEDARALPGARRLLLAAGSGAVFTCVMTWLLKPSFAAMLILANLPVVISLFLAGSSRRDKLALALLPSTAAGLLLILPEAQLRKGDPNARSFLAESLFTVHADLIRDQMAADLAQHRTAPYDPQWLAATQQRLATEIQDSTKARALPSMGFNPDYVKTSKSFVGWANAELGKKKAVEFYEDYYQRVWERSPGAMLSKVWRQLRVFYRWSGCPAYVMYHKPDLQPEYARSATLFDAADPARNPTPARAKIDRYPPTRQLFEQCAALGRQSSAIFSYAWVESANALLTFTYLPLCFGALLLSVAGWVFPRARRWSGLSLPMVLFLYSYNFGTTLSLAVGHTLDIGRYSMYQLSFTLLAQMVAAWLGLEAALAVVGSLARRYEPVSGGFRFPEGLALAARSPFSAAPVPMPGPVAQNEGKLSLGILLHGSVADGDGDRLLANCREVLPEVRVFSPEAVAGGMGTLDTDVLLLANPANPAVVSPEAGCLLVRSYLREPADLISIATRHPPRWVEPFARLLRLAVGRESANPLEGLVLLSRRFYQGVPLPTRLVGDERLPAWELALSANVQAAGRGFRVRELPAEENGSTGEAAPAAQPVPGFRERCRLGGRSFWLCCQCRPWRCLGAVAAFCLFLAMGFAAFSVHRKPHARHRYAVRRSAMVTTCLLGAAAVSSLAVAARLAARHRHWREAFLLRSGRGDEESV